MQPQLSTGISGCKSYVPVRVGAVGQNLEGSYPAVGGGEVEAEDAE